MTPPKETPLEASIAKAILDRPHGIRMGQAAFNALAVQRPEWAERLKGTDSDPFYSDSRLGLFWVWLWSQEGEI